MYPCNNFGLWTVNKKLEEYVTLHSDFLQMSYELNIKMKCVAPLLLGDVKNFLITPHILCSSNLLAVFSPFQCDESLKYRVHDDIQLVILNHTLKLCTSKNENNGISKYMH